MIASNIKNFKTIDEQIVHLEKLGLIINDKNHAKDMLLKYNYQNFINGYNDPFLKGHDRNKNFEPGTKFEAIEALFEFDKQLSNLIQYYVQEIERIFSTNIAYYIGIQMSKNNINDGLILNIEDKKLSSYFRLINKVDSKYIYELMTRFIENRSDKLVDKYKTKINNIKKLDCKIIPIWTLALSWSFGDSIEIFDILSKPIKSSIVKSIFPNAMFNDYELSKIMRCTKILRNRISHNNVVFSASFSSIQAKFQYFIKANNINASLVSKNLRLMDLCKIIDCLLGKKGISSLEDRINNMFNKMILENTNISYSAKKYIKIKMNT